jgi:hypothetical protein
MSYAADMYYGDANGGGSLPPSMLNPGAQSPGDIFLTGIANAGVSALGIASGQQLSAPAQAVVQQSNQLQNLLLIGLVVWYLASHKGA